MDKMNNSLNNNKSVYTEIITKDQFTQINLDQQKTIEPVAVILGFFALLGIIYTLIYLYNYFKKFNFRKLNINFKFKFKNISDFFSKYFSIPTDIFESQDDINDDTLKFKNDVVNQLIVDMRPVVESVIHGELEKLDAIYTLDNDFKKDTRTKIDELDGKLNNQMAKLLDQGKQTRIIFDELQLAVKNLHNRILSTEAKLQSSNDEFKLSQNKILKFEKEIDELNLRLRAIENLENATPIEKI